MLERELAALCRKAARGIASGERRSLRLRAGELEPWLGPVKFKPEVNFSTDSVGLVHGLAWTSVGGEVLEFNESLNDAPDRVNADPYGEGWIVKIRMSDPSELGVLLSADDYAKLIG